MRDSELTLNQVYDEYGKMGNLKQVLYDWNGLNEKLFFAINGIHSQGYDQAMLLISNVGNRHLFIYYLLALFIPFLITVIAKKMAKKAGIKTLICRWLGVFTVLIVGYFTMGATVWAIKEEMGYSRPYHQYGNERVVVLEQMPPQKATESFPSGHSAFIAFMVTALWPLLSMPLRWLGGSLIFGVGWSRIALGVHFPADVLGGILIAILITRIVRAVIYLFYQKYFNWNC